MKEFPYKKVLFRYRFFALIFTLLAVMIVAKAAYIMFVKRSFWMKVSERYVRENVSVPPMRGNIFSADGQLLATSLPEYKIFIDFVAYDKDSLTCKKAQRSRDSLFKVEKDSLAIGLNHILPDKSVGWYRNRLEEGFEKKSRHWLLYPVRISHMDFKEIHQLPFLNRGPIASGFHIEKYNETKKPFGSLASRTLGDMYPGKDVAKSGLELAYDSLLRGKSGITHRQKVRNQYLNIVDVPPVDGADIMTTIDVKMQDFAEKAIVDKLKEVNGIDGVVLVMEVATGDIKAIVNMSRCEDGEYREIKNTAVSNLMEPGSVFKPMSFLVAFDDGKLSMNDCINVAGGVRMMYGRKMKDHNWRRGGYGVLTVPECLEYSSNVGVSTLIDRIYHNCPDKFVNGLYRLGVAEDLHLDIPGYARPRIRRPRKDGNNWSNTALAWMSIGYETQVPPISVLNFYNGVANNGRMMRPRFVTSAMRNGEIIQEYPPQVIRERMCSPQALKKIQTCLRWVVSKGLGKKAGSPNFSVSGKTGTAQVWARNGFSLDYLVSFAGYFPSEAPKYSCMVCILKHGLPASGGGQCGPVFKKVAEMAMASTLKPDIESACDTLHNHMPMVDYGNLIYANKVLEDLDLSCTADWTTGNPSQTVWGRAVTVEREILLKSQKLAKNVVPDVTGMGARDAVYLLEHMGMRISVDGFGIVQEQSLPYGHFIVKGEKIHLHLGMKCLNEDESAEKREQKEPITQPATDAADNEESEELVQEEPEQSPVTTKKTQKTVFTKSNESKRYEDKKIKKDVEKEAQQETDKIKKVQQHTKSASTNNSKTRIKNKDKVSTKDKKN